MRLLALLVSILVPVVSPSRGFAESAAARILATQYITELKAQRQKVSPRATELLTLPNRLKVFLVSDPQNKKSAVAVHVGVGMYSDPQQYRGLAHYLEHMLFLGSDKYPNATDYGDFTNAVQGESNAFTQGWSTNYYLTVPPDAFKEGVDRIAQFFIAPKFDEQYLSKELNAIQSEYDKNITGLGWRYNYLKRETILPTHPAHWLFQGNMATLGKIPREVLLNFYTSYYSANNITVTLIGPQSLAELKTLAVKSFSDVPNRNITIPVYPAVEGFRSPTPRLFLGKTDQQTYVQIFSYALPPQAADAWMTKDLDLVAQLFSDKAEGSFASTLKSLGWATDVAAWYDTSDPIGAQFGIEVDFTPEGYRHWREIGSGVLSLVEAAKKLGLNGALFKNVQRTTELDFLFKTSEPADEAVLLNQAMQLFPADDAEAMMSLVPSSSATTYQSAMELLSPKNLNVFLLAPDIQGDKKTDFYDLEYSDRPLSAESWSQNPQALPGFKLIEPMVNRYLPQNLQVASSQDATPLTIASTPLVTAHLQRDGTFNRPRGAVIVKYLTGPQVQATAEDSVLAKLYVDYLTEALERWYFEPSQVGFSFEITPTMRGLNFVFNGYSDRLELILGEFFQQVKAVKIDAVIFARVLDNAKRELTNRGIDDAYDQALWIKDLTWNRATYSDVSFAKLLDTLTVDKLADFQTRIYSAGRSDVLEYGNLTTEQGLNLSTLVAKSLTANPTSAVKPRVSTQAPLGTSSYSVTRPGANNSWVSEFQLGPNTASNVARARLLESLMSTEFYNHMRTEKQYGYIVFAWSQQRRPHTGFNLLVQSTVPAIELGLEAHRWLKEDFLPALKATPDADFKAARNSLAAAIRLKPASFEEKLQPVQSAFLTDTTFDFDSQVASAVEKLELAEIVATVENQIVGSERREFSVYLSSLPNGNAAPAIPSGERAVPSLEDYWKRNGLW